MSDVPIRYLIAIFTSKSTRANADAQRKTWIASALRHHNLDVRFFLAQQDRGPAPDEVFLDCSDLPEYTPQKLQLMIRWAQLAQYAKVFKTHDDCYIFTSRLLDNVPKAEYAGHVVVPVKNPLSNGPLSKNEAAVRYCSGFGYWIGREAMRYIVKASPPVSPIGEPPIVEDWWVGNALGNKGIRPVNIEGIAPLNCVFAADAKTVCAPGIEPSEMIQIYRSPQGVRERKTAIEEQRRQAFAPRPTRGSGDRL